MAHWVPSREWSGEDAYVIGGGPSLRTFDWDLVRGLHTVGCNSAYSLGADVCKLVVFGDELWWTKIGREGTEAYGGRVVGSIPRKKKIVDPTPWLLTMPRSPDRHIHQDSLTWAGSTGSLAICLAIALGARRVFLLGYDMKLAPRDETCKRGDEGRANWHTLRYEGAKRSVYEGFITNLRWLGDSIKRDCPEVEVYNVTDDSDLDAFPKVGLADHFSDRKGIK